MKLDLPELQDQRVLVLGLGDSGLAMARWCARFGAQVTVWDSREQPPQRAALGELAQFITGELTPEQVAGFQAVLKSPGLSPLDARLKAVYEHGPAVCGELDLFARALAAHQGNISRTAEFVGMERSALHRKLRALGVSSDQRAPGVGVA